MNFRETIKIGKLALLRQRARRPSPHRQPEQQAATAADDCQCTACTMRRSLTAVLALQREADETTDADTPSTNPTKLN